MPPRPDKFLIVGDTHGDFAVLEKIIESELSTGQDILAVLHAGDLEYTESDTEERDGMRCLSSARSDTH